MDIASELSGCSNGVFKKPNSTSLLYGLTGFGFEKWPRLVRLKRSLANSVAEIFLLFL